MHPIYPLSGGMLGKSAGVMGVSSGCCSCPQPRPPTHTHTRTHSTQILINIKEHSRSIVEGQTWRLAKEISSQVLARDTISPFFPRPFQPSRSTELDSPRRQPQEQPERKLDEFYSSHSPAGRMWSHYGVNRLASQTKAETNDYSHHWIFQTEVLKAETGCSQRCQPLLRGHWGREWEEIQLLLSGCSL